jgi:hypothetical protein
MYRLNLKNPVVKKFVELDNAIYEFHATRLEKEEATIDSHENESDPRLILA